MFDITTIIEAAFALIAVVITAIFISFIKSKTTVAQQQINGWVKIAVAAAEQIYVGSGRGVEKKAHVLAFLKNKGVTLDVESVDAMIESAVYELTQGVIEIGAPVAGQED